MDNTSLQQQETDTQQKRSFFIFGSLLPLIQRSANWLAGLFLLSEEEQEDAGVYLSRPGDE